MLNKEKILSQFYIFDRFKSMGLDPHTKLIIRGDGYNWVLSSIAKEMIDICLELGISTLPPRSLHTIKDQCVFYTSKYEVLLDWKKPKHRIAFPYFHGDPEYFESKAAQGFKKMFETLKNNHEYISRIQVSNTNMQNKILNTGIDPYKVFYIPISIDLNLFPLRNELEKNNIRKELGIPNDDIVIGSFQKDSNGWGEGNVPKLIKGPDIFVETIKNLSKTNKKIHILLSGPARGYIKKELSKINVNYNHIYLDNYRNISKLYKALDIYLVTSRDEGGPRAILESMATGVPIISTKVGQAADLIKDDVNGWLVDIEDIIGLTDCTLNVIDKLDSIENIIKNARKTAEENSYSSQIKLWQSFMKGFIND
tara:strand:+ start:588 stop:1688 length:1101 start_codon:yes stop_codon:yes gene_type:complete